MSNPTIEGAPQTGQVLTSADEQPELFNKVVDHNMRLGPTDPIARQDTADRLRAILEDEGSLAIHFSQNGESIIGMSR